MRRLAVTHSNSSKKPSTNAVVKKTWKRENNNYMDQRTRKLHKALHPRDDIDRLYVSRREGGRGLASIEDGIDVVEDYIEK